jgi:mono/diheme cytochrome c family protein
MPRSSVSPNFIRLGSLALAAVVFAIVAAALAADKSQKPAKARSGEDIYRDQCAACHGAAGQGTVDSYPHPLAGDKSQNQLAAFIAKSMPEDDPGTCVGDDAKNVAAYVFDSFYSPAARARIKPARVELAHVTVNQYVNLVADLVGNPRGGQGDNTKIGTVPRGLRASYTARHRAGDQVHDDPPVQQVDACINYDFAKKGPLDGKITTQEYEIHWRGALFAPETGEYEFDLDTSGGCRLFLNNDHRPLIDALVRSGGKSEHRASIRLLGGRTYPIHVEYIKGKGESGRVALRWKPPQTAEEAVPARCLSTNDATEVFVLQTPLPADDRSAGYERGTSVSKQWEQAITDAAIEVGSYVSSRSRRNQGMADESPGHDAKTREFCRRFVERAFRRPLTDAQRQLYIDRRFQGAPDLDTAVRRVVLMTLISPRFLYVPTDNGQQATANRLALEMWDSLPDDTLRQAAAAGKLSTEEQIRGQARRMLADPRARTKLRLFFLQWMKVESPPDLAKDPKTFKAFDGAIAADLRTSLKIFVENVMWDKASDFRQLLLANYTYMNDRLASYYEQKLPDAADSQKADFQKVKFEPGQRAGILSHPYLMAVFAHAADSSPIHRGVFISRGVLGLALRPPPMAIAPTAPELQPTLTTRERVELQTRPEACQSCHATINPLGFALERFDASGRLRKQEKGRPINATGAYRTRDGKQVQFAGPRELAEFLAASDEVHEAFVQQLFRYMVKQPVQAYGLQTLADIKHAFAAKDYNMQDLVVEIVARSVAMKGTR